ncbi:hypothetical protein DFJ73DRAFT_766688 [Zopfochytrium polystomum]|nr:hypothetical protein DFJ73DRAFT_766688 [Zopfochytrium polystomum]
MSRRTYLYWLIRWWIVIVPYTLGAWFLLGSIAVFETQYLRLGFTRPPDSASLYVLAYQFCLSVTTHFLVLTKRSALHPKEKKRQRGAIAAMSATVAIGSYHLFDGLANTWLASIETAAFWFFIGYASLTDFDEGNTAVKTIGAAGLFVTSIIIQKAQMAFMLHNHTQRYRRASEIPPPNMSTALSVESNVDGTIIRKTSLTTIAESVAAFTTAGDADEDDAEERLNLIQYLNRINILSVYSHRLPTDQVYQVVPTVAMLRLSEAWVFALFVFGALLVKPFSDVGYVMWVVARRRGSSFRAVVRETLSVRSSLDLKFHSYAGNHCGMFVGVITAAFFFCYDTPVQTLSPACADRLKTDRVVQIMLRGGFFLLATVALDVLYFARLLNLHAKLRVAPDDADAHDVRDLEDGLDIAAGGAEVRFATAQRKDADPASSWEPSLTCGWESALAGGAGCARAPVAGTLGRSDSHRCRCKSLAAGGLEVDFTEINAVASSRRPSHSVAMEQLATAVPNYSLSVLGESFCFKRVCRASPTFFRPVTTHASLRYRKFPHGFPIKSDFRFPWPSSPRNAAPPF